MSDEQSERRPQDAKRINVDSPDDVNYWCQQFGCSEAQLRAAVQRAGTIPKHVQNWISYGDDD
jgi:hypothetical protein